MGKILFIRGGAVGDFILTLPAIQLVRSTLPDVEIEILGYESITGLAVRCGLADPDPIHRTRGDGSLFRARRQARRGNLRVLCEF